MQRINHNRGAFFTRWSVVLLIGILWPSIAMPQSANSDHCEVQLLDITSRKIQKLENVPAKSLGNFDTVMAEEEATTRVFRLPKTSLFLIASVWYTDESMASDKGADSVSLELMVSKKPKRDFSVALYFADSETPVNGFDVGRVAALFKSMGRTMYVVMQCRRKNS